MAKRGKVRRSPERIIPLTGAASREFYAMQSKYRNSLKILRRKDDRLVQEWVKVDGVDNLIFCEERLDPRKDFSGKDVPQLDPLAGVVYEKPDISTWI